MKIYLTLIVLSGLAAGFCIGMGIQEERYRKQAIQRGYAHYELDNMTGKTTWNWNK